VDHTTIATGITTTTITITTEALVGHLWVQS
jgi:hypothetical protein